MPRLWPEARLTHQRVALPVGGHAVSRRSQTARGRRASGGVSGSLRRLRIPLCRRRHRGPAPVQGPRLPETTHRQHGSRGPASRPAPDAPVSATPPLPLLGYMRALADERTSTRRHLAALVDAARPAQCAVCFDDFFIKPSEADPPTAACRHDKNICDDCLRQTYEHEITSGRVPVCPGAGCREPLSLQHLRSIVSRKHFNT